MEMWYGYNIQKDARESPRPPLGGLFHSARCARLRSTTRQGAAPRKQTAQMINQTRKTTYKGCESRATLGPFQPKFTTLKGLNQIRTPGMMTLCHNRCQRFWFTRFSPRKNADLFCATRHCARNCTDISAEFWSISIASQ